jgi:hypothetical protein
MDKFGFIDHELGAIEIPYEFGEWSSGVCYPYYVGEITEEPTETEDGAEQSTLILTGFHRGKLIALEQGKERIKKHFHPIHGLRGNTDSGSIAVFFDGSFYVPTGEAGLKKIEIHLKIKEWKGDL